MVFHSNNKFTVLLKKIFQAGKGTNKNGIIQIFFEKCEFGALF